jgi:hypothetical protein
MVTAHAQFDPTAIITSVVTVGKDDLTGAETSRASLILDAFKGGDALLTTPFVRKIFFPDYPLETLKWPALPKTQPKVNFTHRQLNESQQKAVEKCLSNKEEDRHVVIVVSSFPSLPYLISPRVSGAARDRQNHCDCRHSPKQGHRALGKYNLDHRTVKRRGQERRREIGRIRFLGFQAPRLYGLPFRLVS